MRFVRTYRPDITIVFHQPLYGVDSYRAKSLRLVNDLAAAADLPVKSFSCGGRCHGTFTGWHNRYTTGRAVTVELGRTVSTWRVNKLAAAALRVAAEG